MVLEVARIIPPPTHKENRFDGLHALRAILAFHRLAVPHRGSQEVHTLLAHKEVGSRMDAIVFRVAPTRLQVIPPNHTGQMLAGLVVEILILLVVVGSLISHTEVVVVAMVVADAGVALALQEVRRLP